MPAGFDGAVGAQFSDRAGLHRNSGAASNEPELTALIERALRENRTLAQVEARLDEARRIARPHGVRPVADRHGIAADRERSDPSSLDPFLPSGQPATTVYRAGFDASWEIDLFGASRRAASAARSETTAREG